MNGGVVANNDIGNFETTTGENDFGIWLATGATNVTVNANRIHDIRYTGTSGYGGKGIAVSTGVAAAAVTVSNNMIFNITGDGDCYSSYGCTYAPVGIYAYGRRRRAGSASTTTPSSCTATRSTTPPPPTPSASGSTTPAPATSAATTSSTTWVGSRRSGAGAVAIALETSAVAADGGRLQQPLLQRDRRRHQPRRQDRRHGLRDDGRLADGLRPGCGQHHGESASTSATPTCTSARTSSRRSATPARRSRRVANDYDGDLRTATPDIGADEFTVYTLATAVVGGGTITVAPVQTAYAPGTSVTLTAVPADACQMFAGWSGDAAGNDESADGRDGRQQDHHGDVRHAGPRSSPRRPVRAVRSTRPATSA